MKQLDLQGQKFGRYTVIEFIERRNNTPYWLCECSCKDKTRKKVSGHHLKTGKIKSCGCFKKENPGAATHKLTDTRLYSIWLGMKQRCYYKKHIAYNRYGARGITVCKIWKNDFIKFYDWSNKNGYQENLTIDRIDNSKGYNPTNCRWVSYKTQANNKENNHKVEYKDEIHTISEWAEILQVDKRKLNYWINHEFSLKEIIENKMKVRGLDNREYVLSLSSKVRKQVSAPHLRARKLLKKLYPLERVYEEITLPGSKTGKNGVLYLDFFIPTKTLGIEVQGLQHEEFNSFFHANQLEFRRAQARDSVKRQWCELNDIELVELREADSDEVWIKTIEDR